MKNLLVAGKLLLLDLASTFFFLIVYSVTKNIVLSVVLGMALGVAQIGWELARKKPIDTMQWLSLFLVMGFGTATLISNNPHFVMASSKEGRAHDVKNAAQWLDETVGGWRLAMIKVGRLERVAPEVQYAFETEWISRKHVALQVGDRPICAPPPAC